MSNTKKKHIDNILKELDTEGNIKHSIYEGLKTGAISLAGAGVGRVCGRPSLGLGLLTIMLGHYKGSNRMTYFGVGVMAGGGLAFADSLKGPEGSVSERVKGRLKEFGKDLKHRLYLDKFIKPKGSTTNGVDGTDGTDTVQYFNYPVGELNMGSLNAIEDELLRSTEMQAAQVTGYEEFAGTEEPIY